MIVLLYRKLLYHEKCPPSSTFLTQTGEFLYDFGGNFCSYFTGATIKNRSYELLAGSPLCPGGLSRWHAFLVATTFTGEILAGFVFNVAQICQLVNLQ